LNHHFNTFGLSLGLVVLRHLFSLHSFVGLRSWSLGGFCLHGVRHFAESLGRVLQLRDRLVALLFHLHWRFGSWLKVLVLRLHLLLAGLRNGLGFHLMLVRASGHHGERALKGLLHLLFRVLHQNIEVRLLLFMLLDFLGSCLADIYVILELAHLLVTIGHNDGSDAVHVALVPVSFVIGTVGPVHLALAVAQVVLVLPDVVVAALPVEFTEALLLVIEVLSSVLVTLGILHIFVPLALAVLHPFSEFADVSRA